MRRDIPHCRRTGLRITVAGPELVITDEATRETRCLPADLAEVWTTLPLVRSRAALISRTGLDGPTIDHALASLGDRQLLEAVPARPRARRENPRTRAGLVTAGLLALARP